MENERVRPARKRQKITRMSVVDQVCASIKQDIADGVWKAGDKIPSEGEFAEMFGVNRLSVRMALQKLSTLGIIGWARVPSSAPFLCGLFSARSLSFTTMTKNTARFSSCAICWRASA